VADRLSRLDLFRYFERVYCRERSTSPHPKSRGVDWVERIPIEKIIELSHHQAKPNPIVLLEICDNEGISPEDASYVGDSVARDVLMAKRAGVFAIWAAYGAHHDAALYRALVRISHWTSDEVSREQELKEEAKKVDPDYVAQKSFSEVLIALGIDRVADRVANY
jgi:phosphoglycolate phosphatase